MSGPRWTQNPVESGAYWMQYKDADPDICWFHNGLVWFQPPLPGDKLTVRDYAELGCRFYGPIQKPPQD